jgi:Uma2 family endonuclease
MAASTVHHRYTLEEYVRLEAYANVRHEYLAGQIFAMAGGTPEHGTYAANLIGLLTAQLGTRRCRVQTSDVRIRVKSSGLDTYPDASVVCGHAERDEGDPNAIVNPIVLLEVLSPSTEEYDRGEKLGHYKTIESLREVVLVAHDARRIDVIQRLPDGSWSTTTGGSGDSLELPSIGCTIAVDAVYRDPLSSE